MLPRLGQLRDLSPVSEVGLAKENVDGEHEAVVVVLVNILCEECLLSGSRLEQALHLDPWEAFLVEVARDPVRGRQRDLGRLVHLSVPDVLEVSSEVFSHILEVDHLSRCFVVVLEAFEDDFGN